MELTPLLTFALPNMDQSNRRFLSTNPEVGGQ